MRTEPFEVLGAEARFDVDLGALAERHRALAAALHPDRFAGKPATERRMALERAVEVNEAWRVLRDPVRRAEALFRRAGIDVGERSEPPPAPALLMEMMEAREALAAARRGRDIGRVRGLAGVMREKEREVVERLRAGFESARGDGLAALVPVLGELRYVKRFFEEVEAVEEEIEESATGTGTGGSDGSSRDL